MTANIVLCGGPALRLNEHRASQPVRTNYELADQLVVLGVRADPKPHNAVWCLDAQRPMVKAHTR